MNDLSFLSVIELNYVLFISFGTWFTLVCFIKMVDTAIKIIFSKE